MTGMETFSLPHHHYVIRFICYFMNLFVFYFVFIFFLFFILFPFRIDLHDTSIDIRKLPSNFGQSPQTRSKRLSPLRFMIVHQNPIFFHGTKKIKRVLFEVNEIEAEFFYRNGSITIRTHTHRPNGIQRMFN